MRVNRVDRDSGGCKCGRVYLCFQGSVVSGVGIDMESGGVDEPPTKCMRYSAKTNTAINLLISTLNLWNASNEKEED